MKPHIRHPALLVAVLALILSACGMLQQERTQMAAEEARPLSDNEIAAVLNTLNRGEIRQAELALQRSQNPQVLEVAERIITDHLNLQRRAESVAEQAGLVPQENALSRRLEEQAMAITESLEDADPEDFDRAYLDSQETMHELALRTVDEHLLPEADDAQLRELLRSAPPGLREHLEVAEQASENLRG